MIDLDAPTDEEATTDERIEVFSLGGTTYTVPADPGPAFALRYLSKVREFGDDAAADYLLEAMLGDEGYKALSGFSNLKESQLLTVFQVCLDIALGAMEGPKDG